MKDDLKSLEYADFEKLKGDIFLIDGEKVQLKFIEKGPQTPARFREQFILLFDCPEGFEVKGRISEVQHPTIGVHNLLVTKVLEGGDEFNLQIIFN
ncbi:DUF6916 family protein [Flexibacterium corallicola]|uniref:DUF6916 family protein n=1 Tax=Flexibacterium corallicola TaxID=3037259 RepID=UPI00286EEBDE|nr:hypothetical protein [Pseudovibrio sp. M1P-2-3]